MCFCLARVSPGSPLFVAFMKDFSPLLYYGNFFFFNLKKKTLALGALWLYFYDVNQQRCLYPTDLDRLTSRVIITSMLSEKKIKQRGVFSLSAAQGWPSPRLLCLHDTGGRVCFAASSNALVFHSKEGDGGQLDVGECHIYIFHSCSWTPMSLCCRNRGEGSVWLAAGGRISPVCSALWR